MLRFLQILMFNAVTPQQYSTQIVWTIFIILLQHVNHEHLSMHTGLDRAFGLVIDDSMFCVNYLFYISPNVIRCAKHRPYWQLQNQ